MTALLATDDVVDEPEPTQPDEATSDGVTISEVSLYAFTLTVVFGFARVFDDWTFLLPMFITAAYAHMVASITRRRGCSVARSALIIAAGAVLLWSWLFFAKTTLAGIPTGGTVGAARGALDESWAVFESVTAPAPVLTGFVLAACAALLFAVFLSDWAAFRLWSSYEAVIPGCTLFVFCSVLGSSQYLVISATVFIAGFFGFWLCHRVARQEDTGGWLNADIQRGSRTLLITGAALGSTAILAGSLVASHLPGANSPAMVSLRNQGGGPGSRTTISPLVDIQDRLLNQPNVELFTVQSQTRSYWRLTSLDSFEGDIWKSSGKYVAADGDLESPLPGGVQSSSVKQMYKIDNLSALWLPAAFEPLHVESPDAPVRYQAETSTLIVDTTVNSSDGLTYQVTSALPHFTKEQLATADNRSLPADVAATYLQMPRNFSSLATQIADTETATGANPYEKARLLQDYFRKNYTYNQHTGRGHSTNAINAFILGREGYCEQFAGSYAAMARTIGLPARVAVGFTPGDYNPTTNTYTVRGAHAHAWPEVYLGKFGWVPFEPTPSRGAPDAEQYTGVTEAVNPGVEPGTTAPPSTVNVESGTLPALPDPQAANPPPAVEAAPLPLTTTEAGTEDQSRPLAVSVVAALMFGLIALAALYTAVVLTLRHERRVRRRRRAVTPNDQMRATWSETLDALAVMGMVPDHTETREEFASRVAPLLTVDSTQFMDLARGVDAADYSPEQLDPGLVDRATAVATAVKATAEQAVSPARRAMFALDPRLLIRHHWTARRTAGAAGKGELQTPVTALSD